MVKIAEKYEERLDRGAALGFWERLAGKESEYRDLALIRQASNKTMLEDSPDYLKDYIQSYPDSPYLAEAYSGLRYFYRSARDTVAEVALFEEILVFLEEKNTLTPSDLNSYAWRMTQLEQNLEDALVKIRQAVQMLTDQSADVQAGILDTEAEVLWKLGRSEEAVQVINKCIELQPEDQYFKNQKDKFLKS